MQAILGFSSAAAQPSSQLLSGFRKRFKVASKNGDLTKMENLHAVYLASGAAPQAWIVRDLVYAYSQHQGVDAAFAAVEDMKRQGLRPDGSVYYALLHACAQARRPPHRLDPRHAERAAQTFGEARDAGAQMGEVMWAALLECQAKAGLPDAAWRTIAEARAAGLPLSARLYNLLIMAHARAGRAEAAEAIVHSDMAADGVAPDLVTWNSLLRAYGSADDMDACYRVWQEMQAAGVVPDQITQMHLSQAFASNPALAAELVAEASNLAGRRPVSEQPTQVAGASAQEGAAGAAAQQPGARLRQQLRQPLVRPADDSQEFMPQTTPPNHRLDLHHMSAPTARVALLQWLDHVAAWLQQQGEAAADDPRSFWIITGQGRHSHPGVGGVLREVAAEVLRRRGLPFMVDAANPGKLEVAAGDAAAWADREAASAGQVSFSHRIGLRFFVIFGTVASATAAMVLVPDLLSYGS